MPTPIGEAPRMASPAAAGLRLFLGPDRFRKRERVDALARGLALHPLDRHEVSAAELSPVSLARLIREVPAASPLRLVIIDDAHRLSRECSEVLVRYRDALRQTACVVLLMEQELEARHPVKSVGAHASIEEFGASEDPARAQGGFALTDAIAKRDAGAALGAMEAQLAEGKEPVELVGLIAWQLQRWLTVGHLLEAGTPRARIAAITGLQAWQVDRLAAELAGRPTAQLGLLLRRCWQVDVEAKTGRTIPRVALEGLVVELCGVASARSLGPVAA